jgi:hypothetical protein
MTVDRERLKIAADKLRTLLFRYSAVDTTAVEFANTLSALLRRATEMEI